MKGITTFLFPLMLPVLLSAGYAGIPENTGVQQEVVSTLRVSEAQIIAYLQNLGYTVVTSDPIGGGCNWICETYKFGLHYNTTVFTNCNSIIGHEDVDY